MGDGSEEAPPLPALATALVVLVTKVVDARVIVTGIVVSVKPLESGRVVIVGSGVSGVEKADEEATGVE
jgi:hypothetical protein